MFPFFGNAGYESYGVSFMRFSQFVIVHCLRDKRSDFYRLFTSDGFRGPVRASSSFRERAIAEIFFYSTGKTREKTYDRG